MRSCPPCKINLGLRILRRRPDGYHDLETLFLPVPFLHDELEISPVVSGRTGSAGCPGPAGRAGVTLTLTGIAIGGDPGDNLCVKAYSLLKADFPDLPPVHIRLHKSIPFGAGLGGGSADAAFTLKALNGLFSLGLGIPQLEAYAARLGADCAFFVRCCPAFAEGIGDRLTPLGFNPVEGLHLLLVKPPDAVSTREAYASLVPHEPSPGHPSIKDLLAAASFHLSELPDGLLPNDFEASVFPRHPVIAGLKHDLIARGAAFAAMSGSGSTVFAFFDDPQHLAAAAADIVRNRPDCLVFHE